MSLRNVAWKTAISRSIQAGMVASLYLSLPLSRKLLTLSVCVWASLSHALGNPCDCVAINRNDILVNETRPQSYERILFILADFFFLISRLILDEGHTFSAVYTFECKSLCRTSHSIALSLLYLSPILSLSLSLLLILLLSLMPVVSLIHIFLRSICACHL